MGELLAQLSAVPDELKSDHY